MTRAAALVTTLVALASLAGCANARGNANATAQSSGTASPPATAPDPASTTPAPTAARAREGSPLAKGAPCEVGAVDGGAAVPCARFASPEDAFRAVVDATDPLVLAVGEAHAQKGSEGLASATKRFTTALLPLVASRASDLVVELWAPDPRCQKAVEETRAAQKPVTTAQATSNVNEYETLGVRAKALGTTPWLLRPTCDDFGAITRAGDDAVAVMLGLVKRLTAERVRTLLARGASAEAGAPRTVIAYGGMMHNDLAPPPSTAPYSFGPELVAATGGRYVELDLVVPEYVKATSSWMGLPWYATHEATGADATRTTLYEVGARSFVLVFPRSDAREPPR